MLKSLHKKALSQKKQTLSCHNIVNISQSTTEKIENIYLNEFLKNCINSSDHKININSKLFYTYFEKNNLYEIFFIENFSNKKILLPFIFSEIHNETHNEIFLYNNSFILYCKGEFKLIKEISSEISSDDILSFILQRYAITIDKVHKLSENQINELKNKYSLNKQKDSPQLLNLKKDKKPLVFLLFILTLLSIPLMHYNYFYDIDKSTYKIDEKLHTLEKRYTNLLEHKDKKKSSHIINTLLQIKNFELHLQSINLNKNKIHLFIDSKDKLLLLEFIDMYDGDIKINKLAFNSKTKKFNMEAIIGI